MPISVECLLEAATCWIVAYTIYIVDINIGGKSSKFFISNNAWSGHIVNFKSAKLRHAVVLVHVLVKLGVIESMPICHFDISMSTINSPVSASITNHKSF